MQDTMTTVARGMTIDQEAIDCKLESIRYYKTAYELAIVRGSERYRICYSRTSKSRIAMDNCITAESRVHLLIAFTGSESIDYAKKAANGGTMGGWRVVWTGRTEREALLEGELPHFTDAVCPVSFPEPTQTPDPEPTTEPNDETTSPHVEITSPTTIDTSLRTMNVAQIVDRAISAARGDDTPITRAMWLSVASTKRGSIYNHISRTMGAEWNRPREARARLELFAAACATGSPVSFPDPHDEIPCEEIALTNDNRCWKCEKRIAQYEIFSFIGQRSQLCEKCFHPNWRGMERYHLLASEPHDEITPEVEANPTMKSDPHDGICSAMADLALMGLQPISGGAPDDEPREGEVVGLRRKVKRLEAEMIKLKQERGTMLYALWAIAGREYDGDMKPWIRKVGAEQMAEMAIVTAAYGEWPGQNPYELSRDRALGGLLKSEQEEQIPPISGGAPEARVIDTRELDYEFEVEQWHDEQANRESGGWDIRQRTLLDHLEAMLLIAQRSVEERRKRMLEGDEALRQYYRDKLAVHRAEEVWEDMKRKEGR